jgi:HEAT repeat protein
MVTYFCPYCWQQVAEADEVCPACGADIMEFTRLPYRQKLLRALHHPVADTRLTAIQQLGELRAAEALPDYERLLETEEDFYVLREVLAALAKLDSRDSKAVIERATHHRSKLVSKAAEQLLRPARA